MEENETSFGYEVIFWLNYMRSLVICYLVEPSNLILLKFNAIQMNYRFYYQNQNLPPFNCLKNNFLRINRYIHKLLLKYLFLMFGFVSNDNDHGIYYSFNRSFFEKNSWKMVNWSKIRYKFYPDPLTEECSVSGATAITYTYYSNVPSPIGVEKQWFRLAFAWYDTSYDNNPPLKICYTKYTPLSNWAIQVFVAFVNESIL